MRSWLIYNQHFCICFALLFEHSNIHTISQIPAIVICTMFKLKMIFFIYRNRKGRQLGYKLSKKVWWKVKFYNKWCNISCWETFYSRGGTKGNKLRGLSPLCGRNERYGQWGEMEGDLLKWREGVEYRKIMVSTRH